MDKKNSNKSFGVLFFIVFLLIALWPLVNGDSLRVWSLLIAVIFLVLGLLNSKILNPFKKIWIKFGEILGKIIAPLVMGIIYFIVITPIGLFMRFIGKHRKKSNQNRSPEKYSKHDAPGIRFGIPNR